MRTWHNRKKKAKIEDTEKWDRLWWRGFVLLWNASRCWCCIVIIRRMAILPKSASSLSNGTFLILLCSSFVCETVYFLVLWPHTLLKNTPHKTRIGTQRLKIDLLCNLYVRKKIRKYVFISLTSNDLVTHSFHYFFCSCMFTYKIKPMLSFYL